MFVLFLIAIATLTAAAKLMHAIAKRDRDRPQDSTPTEEPDDL